MEPLISESANLNRRIMEMALNSARRHATLGDGDLVRQRTVIDDLERHGHDSSLAWKLLQTFEQLQAMHVAEIERLERELARLPERPAKPTGR
jgi:hypothetical protein